MIFGLVAFIATAASAQTTPQNDGDDKAKVEQTDAKDKGECTKAKSEGSCCSKAEGSADAGKAEGSGCAGEKKEGASCCSKAKTSHPPLHPQVDDRAHRRDQPIQLG